MYNSRKLFKLHSDNFKPSSNQNAGGPFFFNDYLRFDIHVIDFNWRNYIILSRKYMYNITGVLPYFILLIVIRPPSA